MVINALGGGLSWKISLVKTDPTKPNLDAKTGLAGMILADQIEYSQTSLASKFGLA